jgi:hypothetical protein
MQFVELTILVQCKMGQAPALTASISTCLYLNPMLRSLLSASCFLSISEYWNRAVKRNTFSIPVL